MTVQQYAPLFGFHRRTPRVADRPVVRTAGTLPPVEVFASCSAELRQALEEWHNLSAQSFKFARAAKLAEEDARREDDRHRTETRAVLAAGEDPASVEPSKADEHRKTAAAHRANHDAAQVARTRLGFDLAPLLEAEAARITPEVNKRLEARAAKLRTQLAKIQDEYAAWAQDFTLRHWLSMTELRGGTITNYDAKTALPRDVADALTTLTAHLDKLAHLESDEAEVRDFRESA